MRYPAALFTAATFALLLIAGGCSEQSPTGPDTVTVTFTPDEGILELQLDDIVELGVEVTGPDVEWSVVFRRARTVVSHDPDYSYLASELGADSLEAVVTLPTGEISRKWYMNVVLGSAPLPPRVVGFTVSHDIMPGSVVVEWYNPVAAQTPRPIAGFQLRVSYGAELISENWDQAEVLDFVEKVSGSQIYRFRYNAETSPAIHLGEAAWFGAKTEDAAGLVSPLSSVKAITISDAYEISGMVMNDEGVMLEDALVIFDADCDSCKTVTAGDGSFSLGPFRSFDKYSLTVKYDGIGPDSIGDCYGVVTDSIGIDDASDVDIVLVKMRNLDAGCCLVGCYDNDFLNLLRHLTMTGPLIPGGAFASDDILRKWDEYPIDIYIPEGVNQSGTLDLGEMVRWCVVEWNAEMGEEYFREVASPDVADVEVLFDDFHLPGQVTVLRPPGELVISQVVPEYLALKIDVELELEEWTTEVIMHELGHALCIGIHSCCIDATQQAYHVMATPPSRLIQLRGWADIVSADEEAVVRAIRNLPQGTRMGRYFSD